MDLDHLKRALFCKYCTNLNILEGRADCVQKANCECREEIEMKTVLDVFANLYHCMNGISFSQYESIRDHPSSHALELNARLQGQWRAHLAGRNLQYKQKAYIRLRDETRVLLRDRLQEATTRQELLLRVMEWLLVLDHELLELRLDLANRHVLGVLPFPTCRGPLIFRCNSPLPQYFESKEELYDPPHDPNYLTLRHKVDNFHLAQWEYKNYSEVSHQYYPMPAYDPKSVRGIQFGFFPGKFDAQSDYLFEIAESPNRDGQLPFAIRGIKDPDAYYQAVTNGMDVLLNQNPEFIMLPEFMTPLDLQESLKSQLAKRSEQREQDQEPHLAQLFFTGSFHANHEDISRHSDIEMQEGLYNYAQVTNGQGGKLIDVFKMNKFVFYHSKKHKGELTPFQDRDGVERNSYLQRDIVLFDTPLGRMAFLICVDFINEDLLDILVDRRIDILFVATMTQNPAGGNFRRKIHDLGAKSGTMIVLCNHLGSPVESEEHPRIVVYVPGFKEMFVSPLELLVSSFEDIVVKCAVS